MNWPSRNPDIRVNDTGEFLGKNYTETDDMTANEILEAWLYLDDFCHFLLYALNAEENKKNSGRVSKSMEYAGRMFHMIQRRTIRDIIIRAHSPFSARKRKAAYAEIVKLDENVEKHLKDVTVDIEPLFDVLSRFLASANFLNGYDTMKMLSIRNRIKWMKICSLIWYSTEREISDFRFVIDDDQTGQKLNFSLQNLNEIHLNRYLAQADSGDSPDALPDLSISNPDISAFGILFRKAKNFTVEISVGEKIAQARQKI